ncbi:MAG: GNAT family N-acetyltransferase [Deltaproteobacteria bacterium]|nr:GNAT family N-acetyltransferase [Deltaproteobacteria bacterium]MBI3295572.1 GNAT family N-acetyltransferase [Deltaproteobacteria bacterium]
MPRSLSIQSTTPELLEKILPLIANYQEFYKCTPDTDRNRQFFSQFIGEDGPGQPPRQGIQFVALDEANQALGFATVYFLPSSLTGGWYCVMNDLLVAPEARGQGIGRKLIEHCQSYARAKGFDSVDWMTQGHNHTAQSLYNQLGADRTDWFYYSLPTGLERDTRSV